MGLFIRSAAVFYALFNTLNTGSPIGAGGSTADYKGYQLQLWYYNQNDNLTTFAIEDFNTEGDTIDFDTTFIPSTSFLRNEEKK